MAPTTTSEKMPTWFLNHGGGPMPAVQPDDPKHAGIVATMRSLASNLKIKPQAILLISGHYEAGKPTVVTAKKPGIIYDYQRRWPDEAYQLQYPAPGSPALALRVQQLLRQDLNICARESKAACCREAGIEHDTDEERGFDHGVFVPLLNAFPEANIPVVELSMVSSLDPRVHIKLGNALAPLREEGVLIIGSGATFHNLKEARTGDPKEKLAKSQEFDSWLQNTLSKADLTPKEREEQFSRWDLAPHFAYCHPREEHLIPAHVCLGAALGHKAEIVYAGLTSGAAVSSYAWA